MYARRTLIAPQRVFNMKVAGWNPPPCANPVSFRVIPSEDLKRTCIQPSPPSSRSEPHTKKVRDWDDHPSFVDDINKKNLIKKIHGTGWKFNSRTKINYEDYDAFTLSEFMFIMEIGNSCRSFNKPHTVFNRMIKEKTDLGIAGPGHSYWKKEVKGLLAHRLYDQLFKLSKKAIH
jgi:hypothetical protein